MHVIEVENFVVSDLQIDALREARLAGFPAQVVLVVMAHRKVAEDDVAEERVAEMTRRRHHPAHAQRGADLRRLARLQRAGADYLLQRDDVGDRWTRAPPRSAAGASARRDRGSDGCCR